MELFVLVGNDDQAIRLRRAELLDGCADVEHVDIREDGGSGRLADAVGALSLFGGIRTVAVEAIDALDDAGMARLEADRESSTRVVARVAAAVKPKLRARLAALGSVERFDLPRARDIPGRIDALARRAGVQLDGPGRRMLVERAGHDLERVESALNCCALAGLTRPQARQLAILCGTAAAPGVPWDMTDALEAGRVADALESARDLEPIAVLAYLAKRYADAARLVEGGTVDREDAMALGVHAAGADRLVRLANQLGERGARYALELLRGADRRVKYSGGDRAHAIVDLTAAGLARGGLAREDSR